MIDEDKDFVIDLLVQWEEEFEVGCEVILEEFCIDYLYLMEIVCQKIDSFKLILWMKKDLVCLLIDQ